MRTPGFPGVLAFGGLARPMQGMGGECHELRLETVMKKHILTPNRLFFVWIALAFVLAWSGAVQPMS